MSEQLNKDISDAIAKHLPQELGTQLQARLAAADAALQIADELEHNNKALKSEISIVNKRAEKFTEREDAVSARETAVQVREEAVTKRELQADLKELEVRLTNSTLQHVKDVVAQVFANNKFKYMQTETTNESHNVPVGVPGGPGMSGYVQQATESHNVTKSTTTDGEN